MDLKINDMETLNFTQFCIKNGYPCDYDTMFHAQLNGSRGMAAESHKEVLKVRMKVLTK